MIWRPYVNSWSKSLSRCRLLDHILHECQLLRYYFEWEWAILGGWGWVWHCSGCVGVSGVVWGIILDRWGIILGGWGLVRKYFGQKWLGGGEWRSVHYLIMPNFNCLCVRRWWHKTNSNLSNSRQQKVKAQNNQENNLSYNDFDLFWNNIKYLFGTFCFVLPSIILYSPGLNKLRARWQAFAQRARKEVFACTKLRARKSIKTLLSSSRMLFKVVSCFCVWKQIILGTTRSGIYDLFQLRSCC